MMGRQDSYSLFYAFNLEDHTQRAQTIRTVTCH